MVIMFAFFILNIAILIILGYSSVQLIVNNLKLIFVDDFYEIEATYITYKVSLTQLSVT